MDKYTTLLVTTFKKYMEWRKAIIYSYDPPMSLLIIMLELPFYIICLVPAFLTFEFLAWIFSLDF